MSPVLLGTIISASFLIALGLRRPLERLFVSPFPDDTQPSRQFFMDVSFYVAVGAAVAFYNNVIYGFPLILSGGKLVVGCAVAGFFSSLDMALARERSVIHHAIEQDKVSQPPKRLYSVTRKFSLVAITTTLFVAIIIVLIIERIISISPKNSPFPITKT